MRKLHDVVSAGACDPAERSRARRIPRALDGWPVGLVCLALSVALAVLFHQQRLQSLQQDLQRDTQLLSEQVESLSTDGKLMGSVMVLGLVDQGIKQLLAGERAPDDPMLQAAFQAVVSEYQSEHLAVLDSAGRTRAYVARDPSVSGLGRDLSMRPYFRRAMAGAATLYPAIGQNSGERGIYVAAPVRATADPQAQVIGAVVLKIGVDKLDTLLQTYPHPALLVSPDGVVFGGNRRAWLLQLLAPVGAEQRARLVREAQFGGLFVLTEPPLLPLQFSDDGARLEGRRYTVAEELLHWPAAGKGWRLLLLRERSWADAWLGGIAVGLAVLVLTLGSCVYALRRRRRRMRQALAHRLQEERMRGMLEALPQGIATLDAAGGIVYANSALERMVGAPAQGLVGQPLLPLLGLQATPAQLLRDCQSAPDQMVEAQLTPLNGPVVPVGLGVASFDDGGERRLVASLRDISERQRAQQAMKRELVFQQRLIDTLPNPLFVKDVQGRYTSVNRAFEQAFAVRREDAVGHTLLQLEVLEEGSRLSAHQFDLDLARNGGMAHTQFERLWADGAMHQVLFWGQGLTSEAGQPVGMVGVLLDVSEQAQAREALREREQQLRDLLRSAPGMVIVTDAEGQLLFHNQNALMAYGIDAPTLAAQGIAPLFAHAADREALFDALQRGGDALASEIEMLRADGSRFWARVLCRRGNFGQSRNAIFKWSTDSTERRKAADSLRAAKDAAEAATAAKSNFLANMSHEIRTPMNAIIGRAHLVLQTRLSAQQRDHVQTVHNAARSLQGIVNDILDFSRIEAGKLVLEQADFDLYALWDQLATLAGEKAGDKPLELVFDLGAEVPRQLRGDALRLGQVLTQLLTNAVKFTAEGEIVLCCRHRSLQDGTLVLDFSVRDTGIGMADEQVARLFTPFSQADGSSTRKFGGTGLGLSISKRLVDAAGGSLVVQSTLGQGAQFSVSWPCARAVTPPDAEEGAEALQGLRALVLDDHDAAGALLCDLLQRLGLVVERAADAAAAMARVHAGAAVPCDLLLVDLHLPGVDGLALTQQLKAVGAAQPAVVVMGPHGDTAWQDAAAAAGASAVLLKPLTPAVLASALCRLYGSSPSGPAGDAAQQQIAIEAEPAARAVGDAQAAAELARLCAMLDSMDSEAGEQLERLEAWLRLQLTNAEMQTLVRHVRQYDMDEALALLRQAPGLARWHAEHPATAGHSESGL